MDFIQKLIALIESNQTLLTVLGIGGAGTIIMWLKGIPVGIYNVLKKEFTTEMVVHSINNSFFEIMKLLGDKYKDKNFRKLRLINGRYGDDSTILTMGFGSHIIRYGHTFLLVALAKEPGNQTQYDKAELTFTKIGRNHKIFEQIVADAKVNDEDRKENRLYEMDSGWSYVRVLKKRSLDSIFIEQDKKDHVLRMLNRFINSEQWYIDHGIPYQLGILLYGPPGTGKTSLIRAIASYLNYSIYYLSPMRLESIKSAVGSLPDNCLLVIEDIDSNMAVKKNFNVDGKKMAEDRKRNRVSPAPAGKSPVRVNRPLSNDDEDDNDSILESFMKFGLSEILNSMDGLFSAHGRILIATTNHPERLVPELTRPGRIDTKVEVGYVNAETLKMFLDSFFPENTISLDGVEIRESISVADLQELILRGYDENQIINFVIEP
jgi:chaperone BCS1